MPIYVLLAVNKLEECDEARHRNAVQCRQWHGQLYLWTDGCETLFHKWNSLPSWHKPQMLPTFHLHFYADMWIVKQAYGTAVNNFHSCCSVFLHRVTLIQAKEGTNISSTDPREHLTECYLLDYVN